MEALEARLRGRGTEDDTKVAKRMAGAAREMGQSGRLESIRPI